MRRLALVVTSVALMILAAFMQSRRNGGMPILSPEEGLLPADTTVMVSTPDGSVIVRTRTLAAEVKGYGGTVPLEIILCKGRIDSISCPENNETPSFFHEAERILNEYIGKSPSEAVALNVDAVSGATYSSRALVENMRRGMEYAIGHEVVSGPAKNIDISLKNICGIVVALLGATLPLFIRSRRSRIILQLLNVGVLGLWCGTFISYSLMLGCLEGGLQWGYAIVPIIMFLTAFVYPFFGKRNYYCNHICPYGSLQELASHIPVKKTRMGTSTLRYLEWFRISLWCTLMFLLISGLWTAWIDLELFSAFIFKAASISVVIAALAFVAISAFVPRAYCRFVCPTGSLLKFF